jgi:cell wall-associated NlpC family hydrolase
MKLFACALPLLAGVPSVLTAQVNVTLPRLQRPAVRATLGPIAVVATLSGHGVSVRATPGSPRRTPTAGTAVRRTGTASASAARVLSTAERYLGTHYRYGGGTPAVGFDCSGFVQYVFGRHGIKLPRTSRLQATAGQALPLDIESLQPGDLLLFAARGPRINHVAIYVGGNRILHSSAGAGGVVYDDLSTPRGKWYLARHVASRRVLP